VEHVTATANGTPCVVMSFASVLSLNGVPDYFVYRRPSPGRWIVLRPTWRRLEGAIQSVGQPLITDPVGLEKLIDLLERAVSPVREGDEVAEQDAQAQGGES
jgi:hypothetical protein